ncbi:MAG: response regulator [Clostridia bacterium]|nr:response regulator [Clostridia bacterium]
MLLSEFSVLICDDSMLVRKKIKDYLNTIGVNDVFEACDGEQAIEMYKANKPKVVLMDIIMPKKTGIEAVTEILKFDKNAKVVMASSVGSQNYLKDAINAGAYDFIQKPIQNEHLFQLLKNLVKEG